MEDRTLRIISKAEDKIDGTRNKRRMVNVLCFCGKEFTTYLDSINQGLTKSCGCLVLQKTLQRFKDNPNFLSHHPLYRVWSSIKTRCFNENNHAYPYYGGRGITMDESWRKDFPVFYLWCINNGYKKGLQIDRVNVNGNYEAANCRFLTPLGNGRNKRNTILIPYKDEILTVGEWAQRLGMSYSLLYSRIFKLKMKPEDAFIKQKVEYMLIDIELSENIKELLKQEGRTQRWLTNKIIQSGCESIDEVKMSNKLKGIMGFTEEEITAINKILETRFVVKKISEK